MITIRSIKVNNEFGHRVWDYCVSIDGQEYVFDSDRSLTLDEIKELLAKKREENAEVK